MSHKNWKSAERRHSRMLGCAGRVGPTGLDLPDSYSDIVAVESKSTGRPPTFVQQAVQQATDNAARLAAQEAQAGLPYRERVPLVIIHEDGTPFDYDLVVMRLAVFQSLVLPAMDHWAVVKEIGE